MTINSESHFHYPALPGQGGLIAAGVTIMLALVLAGATLGNMSFLNAKHSVVTKQTLQTYYAAQAGIQEAIATRMIPRSNYLNFNSNSDPGNNGNPVSDKSYFSRSGNVYKDLRTNNTGNELIARYRYMILGGDAARKPDKSYYNSSDLFGPGLPILLSTDTFPDESPFIVVSEGITCKGNTGSTMPLPNRFSLTGQAGLDGKCQSGTDRDEVVIVATVAVARKAVNGVRPKDQVIQQRVYKNPAKIPLPTATFVPGYGWKNQGEEIDFNIMWNYNIGSDAVKNPLTLRQIVFYDFANNKVEKLCDVYTTNNTSCGATINNVPANAAIRLYFNGPVDFRSISPRADLSDLKLADCLPTATKPNQADQCHIRVVPDPPMSGSNHAYKNNMTIPLYPGDTQVILLPPLVALTPGRLHELQIDTTKMRSFNSQPGPHDYRIKFTTR